MLNETISTCTSAKANLDFNTLFPIMTSWQMLAVLLGIVWGIPLFVYLIVGLSAKGRSANGQATSKCMLSYPNAWYSFLIWGLLQLALIILFLIFPLWAKIF